jgi:hypothetical protein
VIRHWDVQSDLVEAAETKLFEDALAHVGRDPEEARSWQGALVLTFSEYEDRGPPYVDPSVRRFLRALYARVPHLPYFLVDDPLAGALMAFLSVHGPEEATTVGPDDVDVATSREALEALVEHMIATAAFASTVGDDAERVISRMVTPLGEKFRAAVVADALAGAGLN